MDPLPPWANGPFELIVHAEAHLIDADDFDRRIALISFDDAIEVSIATYLTLQPIQRGNRSYSRADVDKWMNNYHTKIEFLEKELQTRGLSWDVDKSHILWAHDQRNVQYHGGQKGVPDKHVLEIILRASLWVFSTLFDVTDAEARLSDAIAESAPRIPQRDKKVDRVIDRQFGTVDVGGQSYYTSELLFAIDYDAYQDLGSQLCDSQFDGEDKEKTE
jgi:hypothetical protein